MRIHRIAVSTFFFFCGFLFSNWIARVPEVQDHFGINHSLLGTLLLVISAGAILAMPFSGWMTVKLGSYRLTQIFGLMSAMMIPLMLISSNYFYVLPFFFLCGFGFGATDVAMNAQAVFVERMYDRPIMSSFHAIFSVGTALGGVSGAMFSKFEVPLFIHLSTVSIFSFIMFLVASFFLINDQPDKSKQEESSGFILPNKAILPIAILAFCGMTGEGSLNDWSALFMNEVVGQTEDFSAWGFVSFAAAMTISRFLGDSLRLKFGKRNVLLYSCLAAIAGLVTALFFATPYMTLFGFFICGLGLANIVPIIYSTAGNMEGLSPSVGIAMATTIGYMGFFVGPPVIGFLSDAYGLTIGLCFTLSLFLVMFGLILRIKI